MAATKPLPTVPGLSASGDAIPPLTPAYREHLRKIVALAVTEEGLTASWTPALLRSIQDVGPYLSQTHSLSGICAAKRFRRQKHLEINALDMRARAKRKNPAIPPAIVESDFKKGESSAASNGSSRAPRPLARTEDHVASDLNTRALLALHDLACSAAATSSTPSKHHLLLTLAAPSNSPSSPDPSQCIFVPNQFALPFFEIDDVKLGSGGIDICGVENWNCEPNPLRRYFLSHTLHALALYSQQHLLENTATAMTDILVVGGTFQISKVAPRIFNSVTKVLRVAVRIVARYVLCFDLTLWA